MKTVSSLHTFLSSRPARSFTGFVLLCVLLFTSTHRAAGQSLFINEVMSSNTQVLADEDGDFSDWIEIYNHELHPVFLGGFSLTDKVNQPHRWIFPDTVIGPRSHMLVFASGKDRAQSGSELHTNFEIKQSGEAIYLFNGQSFVHHMPPFDLKTNTSAGMATDGSFPVVRFFTPTPGGPNAKGFREVDIQMSHTGGVYSAPFDFEIHASSSDCVIRYTIDGSVPGPHSPIYTEPLFTDSSLESPNDIAAINISYGDHYYPIQAKKIIVIRAAPFDSGGTRLGSVVSGSFEIIEPHMDGPELPTLSICAEFDDLFDHEKGIFVPGVHWNPEDPMWTGNYYQTGTEWEIPVWMSFFDTDGTLFEQECGLRVHGGNSRRHPQKGMRLYARKSYSKATFEYPFFTDYHLTQFKRLVLRPFMSARSRAGIEDWLACRLAEELDLITPQHRPVRVFLNGEYWGIYYLQERIDKHFAADRHGAETTDIDLLEGMTGGVTTGSNEDFLSLMEFVEAHDLSEDSNFDYVAFRVDIPNFIDYQILEIVTANFDWPANNVRIMRINGADNLWRWIFFDGDAAFWDWEMDMFSHALSTEEQQWPTNAESTLLFRKLMENEGFERMFVERLIRFLENEFKPNATDEHFNRIIKTLSPEIPDQIRRFRYPDSEGQWINEAGEILDFLTYRACAVVEQSNELFEHQKSLTYDCVVAESDVTNLVLYPNPNSGQFDLTFESNKVASADLRMLDLSGRVVLSQPIFMLEGSNHYAHRAVLPRGFYILTITTGSGTNSVKVLVQ